MSFAVIVTRPEREAKQWVQSLQGAGWDAVAWPLIEVAPPHDRQPVLQAWDGLAQTDAVMFVSANAVEQFFAVKPPSALFPPVQSAIKTRAYATGPGTREALLRAGVAEMCIDAPAANAAQFDSEALWAEVGPQVRSGFRVLVVRGAQGDSPGSLEGVGRDWFAAQVRAAGGVVEFVVAYQRRCPVLTPQDAIGQSRQVQSWIAGRAVWVFSSSQAIVNLCALLPDQVWGAARAVATHPRIAQVAREAGFAVVCESRPGLAAVVASIESLA
jgi:uroporphyrinogen-III synthase